MKTRSGWIAVASLLFVTHLPILRADSYTFTLIPATGSVSGPPGSTVGWGYQLDNMSASDWLVTSDLQAGTFLDGSPNALFDFPDLGPGNSVAVPFDPVTGSGLYELTWDGSAPIGFTNSGTFELDAQWWTGDPLTGGTFISDAPSIDVNYSAVVTAASSVPEPSSTILLLVIVLGMLGLRRRRRV